MSEKLKALRGQLLGNNWPTCETDLRLAIERQEKIVSEMCDIMELIDEYELEHYAYMARVEMAEYDQKRD
jgi:hypothetical protein